MWLTTTGSIWSKFETASSVIPCSISNTKHGFCRVSDINTGSWNFKTPQVLLAASDLEISWPGDIILKHHSRYLSKIPLEIMPLLIQIIRCENGARFSVFNIFHRLCFKSALSAQIQKYSTRICIKSTLDQFQLKKITWYSLSVLTNDNRPLAQCESRALLWPCAPVDNSYAF